MAYFPFFVDLSGKEGLIVGGGTVALRKAEAMLPYGPRLTVAAPKVLPEAESLPGVTVLRQPFEPALLDGKCFVIAAAHDPLLNRRISALCRRRGVPVNVVDDRAACSFLFPALVRRGSLSVGVSTGGASPTAAVWLKEQINGLLPENFAALLSWLDEQREAVKSAVPSQSRRAALFAQLFEAGLAAEGPLGPETAQDILNKFSDVREDAAP